MATSCAKPILRLAVMCGSLRQSFSLHMYVVSSVSSSLRSARTGAADPWLTSSGGVCQESLAAACYIIRFDLLLNLDPFSFRLEHSILVSDHQGSHQPSYLDRYMGFFICVWFNWHIISHLIKFPKADRRIPSPHR